ncbi:MAG: nuclear transport factor 2 family protein [Bacteroidales bacterium]|nr:nuclear transport factor 2 family protein [Bacteroidales bacterium]
MKSIIQNTILFLTFLFFELSLFSQSNVIDYFGEEPPGYYPKLFAENVFNGTVYTVSYSPDGKEIYYSGNYDAYTIYYKIFLDGEWTDEKEAPFCLSGSIYQDASPCFSLDGKRLYFCSNREGGFGDYDLWYVERNENGWGNPINAGNKVNSSSREDYPYVAKNGSLYFNSGREGTFGFTDIYYSKHENNEFQNAVKLIDTVNTDDWDENPAVINGKLYRGMHNVKHFAVSDSVGEDSWSVPVVVSGGMFAKGYFDGFRLTPDNKYFMYSLSKTGSSSGFETYWVDAEVLNFLGAKEAVFNYVAGWYSGNKEQMILALHPQLEKRQVVSDVSVSSVSYSWMLNAQDNCWGCLSDVKKGKKEITILDESENIATARLFSNSFYDYLHLVKFDGYWKVLNAVWDYHSVDKLGDTASLEAILKTYVKGIDNVDSINYANLFHNSYVGRLAISHSDVHSLNKSQFLTLQSNCNVCALNNDFTYEILDIHKNIASVLVKKGDSLEYLHLSFQNNKWFIINALRNFSFDPERNYNLNSIKVDLSNYNIDEKNSVGSPIGSLSINIPKNNNISMTLDEFEVGKNNNDWFYLDEDTLRTNKVFDSPENSNCKVSVLAVINSKDTVRSLFNIYIVPSTNFEDLKKEEQLIFPNPSKGFLTVRIPKKENIKSISVIDAMGRTILMKHVGLNVEMQLDLSILPKGIYSIIYKSENSNFQKSFIIE